MVASMRKTVKQVVSDYHTSEKAVTLENEDARKLIAMITVILKHGLIGTSVRGPFSGSMQFALFWCSSSFFLVLTIYFVFQ